MTRSPLPVRPIVYILACIPTFDIILNEVNTAFHVTVGPLSLLQAVRSPLLVILTVTGALRLFSQRDRIRHVPLVAIGAFALVAMFVVTELLDTDTVHFTSIGSYGQLLYWVVLWTCTRIECRSSHEAGIVLRGLVVASLLSAGSIILGYYVGGLNPYADTGVVAGAGWFNTAKTITGVLLAGAVLLLYKGAKHRSYIYQILAVVCCGCCVVTYARAGQVALGLLLLWLSFWCIARRANVRVTTATRFLGMMALISVVSLPVLLRSDSFATRWQDVQDGEKGGSGRAAFWRVAVEDYLDARPPQLLLGFGYDRMAKMLYKDYGADIKHTHNDLLDMMLLGGLCGIAWWIGLMLTFIAGATRNVGTIEGMAGIGILLVFICHGQLTGQLLGTDAMVMYSMSLACLSVIGREVEGAIFEREFAMRVAASKIL